MTKETIMILIVLLSMTGIASAGSNLNLLVDTKEVQIGNSTGTDFTVLLNTSHNGPGRISWNTDDEPLEAKIDGANFSESGEIQVVTDKNVEQSHILTVRTTRGATVGQEYSVYLNYCFGNGGKSECESEKAKAKAEATVLPTPELSTAVLMSAGLIGIFGLVRIRKKE